MARFRLSPHSGSGWPVAFLVAALGSFAIGITPAGERLRKDLADWLPREIQSTAMPSRPDVLLIADNAGDQATVAFTLAPRGYNMIFAASAAIGLEKLRDRGDRVGLIVMDPRQPGAAAVQHLARMRSPDVPVIALIPNHSPGELAVLLLANLAN